MNKKYLIHYGIDGQKWGVRNGPPYPLSPSSHSAAEKRANKKAWKTAKKERRKNARDKSKVDSMSNKELNDQINRIRMEQQYKDITKTEFEKGRDSVVKLIVAATAIELGKESFKKLVKKGIEIIAA